jgi:AAA15 family ATPase/GTPase
MYLSSGTIKGLEIVRKAVGVLAQGGYLLVDEIENHLNKQLVGVLIDLFQSSDTNPHGATLLFTTHYPEILDRVHRKDNVYFLSRRSEDHAIQVIKYSSRVKRIENKKSEVFISNYIGGTAPSYTDVQALRALVREAVSHEE